jgi:hypothetical protein
LFVALFLAPWITMYALSTLVMHHRELFTGHERRVAPDFDVIRDGPYDVEIAADELSDDVARRILSDLGISGAHAVQGDAHSGTLTIHRNRPIGSYRVAYGGNNLAWLSFWRCCIAGANSGRATWPTICGR